MKMNLQSEHTCCGFTELRHDTMLPSISSFSVSFGQQNLVWLDVLQVFSVIDIVGKRNVFVKTNQLQLEFLAEICDRRAKHT